MYTAISIMSDGYAGTMISTEAALPPRSRKVFELEAIRGIAAFIVFTGHFFEGLVPSVPASLNGSLLFGWLNGPAAVIVFFVLSSFVLALQPLQSRRWASLVELVLKRWPRLAGPVVVSGFVYTGLAVSGAFPQPDRIGAMLPPSAPLYLFWGRTLHDDDFMAVLHETLFDTFFQGAAQHNPVLWTMHWELLGSLLVAALAATLILQTTRPVRTGLFIALWVVAAIYSVWLLAFPVGVVAAKLHCRFGTLLRIPDLLAFCMVLSGAALLSWDIRAQAGLWAWTAALAPTYRIAAWIATESVAAGFFIAVALYNATARRLMLHRLGTLAGQLSFSFYLLHLAVLLSPASWLYIMFAPKGLHLISGTAVFIISLTLSTALATPLLMFDRWWLRGLGWIARIAAGNMPKASA